MLVIALEEKMGFVLCRGVFLSLIWQYVFVFLSMLLCGGHGDCYGGTGGRGESVMTVF